jgi:hypothetical protein
MDRCICKGNYVNYVKINMPYDIYFYPISILGNRLIDWENYDFTILVQLAKRMSINHRDSMHSRNCLTLILNVHPDRQVEELVSSFG